MDDSTTIAQRCLFGNRHNNERGFVLKCESHSSLRRTNWAPERDGIFSFSNVFLDKRTNERRCTGVSKNARCRFYVQAAELVFGLYDSPGRAATKSQRFGLGVEPNVTTRNQRVEIFRSFTAERGEFPDIEQTGVNPPRAICNSVAR